MTFNSGVSIIDAVRGLLAKVKAKLKRKPQPQQQEDE